jgi:peptidoglycan/LPS O-acetylase OafA/YrhL
MFDWLRLWLAAAVCIGHGYAYIDKRPSPLFPPIIHCMPMVPTFLAVSGFVVLQSYENSRNWRHFIWKRILRIVPALLVSICLSGIVWGFRGGVVTSLITYLSGSLAPGSGGNGSLWSLGWEELAYGCLAILFTLRAYKAKWPIWCLWVVGLWVSFRLGYTQYWQMGNLMPAFFAGNLVYIYRDHFRKVHWSVGFLGIISMIIVNLLVGGNAQNWFTVGIVSFCALIVGLNTPRIREIPMELSYGFYVFHDPIFYWISRFTKSPSIFFAFAVPTLFFVALLSRLLIEKPALNLKNWRPNPRKLIGTN